MVQRERKSPSGSEPKLLRPTYTYNDGWIRRGIRKHEANYSMVVCFETGDPARLEQLKNFFCYTPPNDYESHRIYIYDPWNGLGELNRDGEITPYTLGGSGRFREELGDRPRDLGQVLNIMDTKLRSERTVFIIHGLPREVEGKARLISALRMWANSRELISKRSLVILVGLAPSTILDDETRDLIAMVDVPIGEDSEYEALINYLAEMYGLRLREEERGVLRSVLKGLNLHQSEAVLRESYKLTGRFGLEQIKILKGEVVKKTGILEVEEPEESFEAIGGYEDIKKFINEKIIQVIHNPDRAKRFAIPLPRGILLFGPPGTGKTLFAKALAKEVKLPFINLKTENIYSPWLGESGQRMKTAIKIAEQMSPAIVFIDEIDRFGRRTATVDSAGEETRRVFSQLLEWLGSPDRKAIIVGTTNRPTDLDPAFIRTGRFDYKIPILYPDEEARLEILRIHLGLPDKQGRKSPKPKPPLALSDGEFLDFLREEIVPRTRNYTGAELEELVTRAKRNAFERGAEAVGKEDFYKSLRSFRINIEEREEQRRYYEDLARKYTDEASFLKDYSEEGRKRR
jgi:ATP-dependent 26S proteasome regulatory subunit